jgi:hypothetical protein
VLSGFVCEFVSVLHHTLYGATKRVTAVTKRVTGVKIVENRVVAGADCGSGWKIVV